MYAGAFIILVSAATALAQFITINTPENVGACTDTTITWNGGSPPYVLEIHDAVSVVQTPMESYSVPSTSYTWHVDQDIGVELFIRIHDNNGDVSQSGTFTIQPSVQCPNWCLARGWTPVPQKDTPGPFQCNPGDTGITTDSTGPCAAYEYDGSTIYTSSSSEAFCCHKIPAGTFLCKSPPPCTNYFTTILNAESSCLVGDVQTAVASPVSCGDAATFLGTTVDKLYTLAGATNVCCDSLPVGTTVCIKQTSTGTTDSTTPDPDGDTNTTPHPTGSCGALVPTNAAATSACLANDRSVTLPADLTCDFITTLLSITNNDFYTTSGPEICCNSIPAGTTICVPTASTTSCPSTTYSTTNPPVSVSAPNPPTNVPSYKDWTYLNCYSDSVAHRALPVLMGIENMTVEKCIDTCSGAGYGYAGLEYGGECYCGRTVPPTIAVDGRCSMACNSNSQQICGGPDGISVYHSGSVPSNLQSYNMYEYQGCYEDTVGDRTMAHAITSIAPDAMTVERCIDACFSYGFAFAGLEWSQECFCAQAPPPIPATDGRCGMACTGNPMEYCGGGNGMSVYMYSYNPAVVNQKRAVDL